MEEKGVKLIMNASPTEFKGEDGQVTSVVLQDGQSLPAGLVVLGIGVVPATGFLEDSGLELTDKKAVTVDKVNFNNVLVKTTDIKMHPRLTFEFQYKMVNFTLLSNQKKFSCCG